MLAKKEAFRGGASSPALDDGPKIRASPFAKPGFSPVGMNPTHHDYKRTLGAMTTLTRRTSK
jgi:hypothetical protein